MGFLNKKVTKLDRGYKYYIDNHIVTIVDDINSKYVFNYLAYYDDDMFILSNGLTQYTFYYDNFKDITNPNYFINLLTQAFYGTSAVTNSVFVPNGFYPYGFWGTINSLFAAIDVNGLYIYSFFAIEGGNNMGSVALETNQVPFDSGINVGVLATDIAAVQASLDTALVLMGYAKGDAIYTILNNNEIAIWLSPTFNANIPNDFIHMYAGDNVGPGSYNNKVDFTELLTITVNDIKP